RARQAGHLALGEAHVGAGRRAAQPRRDPERAATRLPDRPRRHRDGTRLQARPRRRLPRAGRPRAAFVVTGSELVRGERTDRNGPFLAREALRLGLEPARIVVVGDRADELEEALRDGLRADLCVVSGGLGPTHDDRTIQLLARALGRDLVLDEGLEHEIGEVSRSIAERLRRPFADFQPGVRKQATLPAGATSLGLAGTAPGVVLEADGAVVVALPGPPAELRRLWAKALETALVRRLLGRARPPGRRVLRFFGA